MATQTPFRADFGFRTKLQLSLSYTPTIAGEGQGLMQRAVTTETADEFLERSQDREGEIFICYTARTSGTHVFRSFFGAMVAALLV